MKFGQLHHVEYYVNDLEKSNQFWNWFLKDLDYKVYQEFKTGISYMHETGTYLVFVEVQEKLKTISNNRNAPGLNHIAFKGKSSEHLQILKSKLLKENIKILKINNEHICFEDPNGFAVEVFVND